jgi:hypothetical protein
VYSEYRSSIGVERSLRSSSAKARPPMSSLLL